MIKEAPKYGKREKEDMLLKTLFGYADRYLEKSSWKDLALIKFCLFAIGMNYQTRWRKALQKRMTDLWGMR